MEKDAIKNQKFKASIRGVKPLLMNSPSKVGEDQSKKNIIYIPADEAEKVAYRSPDKKLCIPSMAMLSALRESAVNFKAKGKGRKSLKSFVYSGLQVNPLHIVLNEQTYVIDARPVGIKGDRIMRWRPRFDKWSCSFEIEVLDPTVWDGGSIKQVLIDVGKYTGILDFRPLYGTFVVEKLVDASGKEIK